jgi:hypothetical protein
MISGHQGVARCHRHTLVESVGTCAVCGKTGCSTCLVQEASGFRCQDCIRKGRQVVQSNPIQPQLPSAAPLSPTAPGQAFALTSQPSLIPLSPPRVQPISPQPAFGRFDPKYTKILFSLALFLAGAAIPVHLGTSGELRELTLSQHITIGYALWALFWGAPAAWRLWRQVVFAKSALFLGCSPIGLAWVLTAFCLLVFGGWFFCLFGGGIYQFLKHWWSIRRTA